jgi:hypothetical protein
MSITTEEAERHARLLGIFPAPAAALRSLAAERDALRAENEKLRAALLLARVAVSHACELSDRILYTQDLVRIDAALGEKE